MNQQTEELHLYFTRVKPMCRELFSMAYTICADHDAAELALQKVILGGWQSRRRFTSSKGFSESLRADMRRAALGCMNGPGEDWNRFGADPIEEDTGDPVLNAIQQERPGIRRIVMLKYGCGLNNAQISRVTGVPSRQTAQLLDRFQRRIKRRITSEQRGKLESRLREICAEQLAEGGAEMPDIGALYRNFEAEASANYSPVGRAASRVAAMIAMIVMLAIIGCVLWGVSAVIRPAQIEDTGLLTETLIEQ